MNRSRIQQQLNQTATKQEKYSYIRPSSSMAEENQVKNFNLFYGNQNIDSLLPTNQPQRIELPIFFNTPIRNNKVNMRKLPQLNNLSFQMDDKNTSVIQGVQQKDEQFEITSKSRKSSPNSRVHKSAPMKTYLSATRRLKDYELLAFACRRAGKQRDEGRAYFSMGILYDNLGKWQKAIDAYKKFLAVCKSINDMHGEGLAYNCIGVDYQFLAQENPNFIHDAIVFHKKHDEYSDVNGKFLASINLGLCYDFLEDQKMSLFYYQNGLKYAIKMSNLVGQSIAIGNIGKIGTKGLYDNTDKMKIFIERYLKLAQELSDKKGLIKGHVKLGLISANRGNYFEGKDNFLKALEMTEMATDSKIYQEAKCGFAVANAECTMDQYLVQLGQTFKAKQT